MPGWFLILFAVVTAIILFVIARAIAQAISNLRQPVMRVTARLVSKRSEVSGGMNSVPTSTNYYVTFETEGGSRQEFSVSGQEFGLLAENDTGILSRQGTWFKGFQRQAVPIRR